MLDFTEEQVERYSRHILLPEVGGQGQSKICESSVLVLGAGGLGSPVALYLAAAGVGRLGIVDDDRVDFSNLQRQILHTTHDVNREKTQSAREKIQQINPDVRVDVYQERLDSENVLSILGDYDLVIDGTDNFSTRFLVNDACFMTSKPLVHGAILQFEGQAITIMPDNGPCYRCIFPEPPPPGLVPSCQQAGVLGVIAGTIGTIQATEALKIILEQGDPLIGRFLIYNALDMRFRTVKARKDPSCPLCGTNPTISGLSDYEEACGLNEG